MEARSATALVICLVFVIATGSILYYHYFFAPNWGKNTQFDTNVLFYNRFKPQLHRTEFTNLKTLSPKSLVFCERRMS